jgi:ubiquinone/menaquinone biosynthesis C-methylase UbiE
MLETSKIPMSSELEFTGERFVPGIAGEIAHEHWHRYAFARRFCAGKRVLDVACGEGYGSALLAGAATSVVGVDIDAGAVAHARASYAEMAGVRFEEGSAASLPMADASVDVVVSFETIEHLPRSDQTRMVGEIARVLAADGVLILSAPNPVEYSAARNYRNPFHQHEPDRAELTSLLAGAFPAQRWFRQRRYFGSAIWSESHRETPDTTVEAWRGDAALVEPAVPPEAMYFVVIAARAPRALPEPQTGLSLFTDRAEGELARIDAMSAEVMRQDGLLLMRDAELVRRAEHVEHLEEIAVERAAELSRQAEHVKHLEEIAAYRERIVVERDGQLADLNALREAEERAAQDEQARLARALGSSQQAFSAQQAECVRLERAISAQERIIAYRQSARWWVSLPWLRLRMWWQRVRGA